MISYPWEEKFPRGGYTGWMLTYFYHQFTVRISTSEDYPAYQSRIYELAGDTEYKIQDYLGDFEKEDEIISSDELEREPDNFYEPLPETGELPDWVKEGQAHIDYATGTAIYVPEWLDWIKPEKEIQGRGTVIEPDGKIWVYNRAFRIWKGPISADTPLYTGDIVATARNATCRVVFRNPEGKQDTITVGGDTLLEVPRLSDEYDRSEYPNLWMLYKGIEKISHAIRGQSVQVEPAPFVVRTPTVVAGVRGTEFVISHNPDKLDSTIHLINGEINYYNLTEGGPEDGILTAGNTLVVFNNGNETIQETDIDGLKNQLAQNNLEDHTSLNQSPPVSTTIVPTVAPNIAILLPQSLRYTVGPSQLILIR